MFSITVDDLSDNDSLPVYELPKESSVFDLKLEIEATEDIATYLQVLKYNKRVLENDEQLDSVIVGDPSDITIYLNIIRILGLPLLPSAPAPDSAGLPLRPSAPVLDPAGLPLRPSAPAPNPTILSGSPRSEVQHASFDRSHPGIEYARTSSRATTGRFAISSRETVKAKYDWGGEIKNSNVKGLALKRGQNYYVIKKRSPVQLDPAEWCYGSKYRYWFQDMFLFRSTGVSKGYFPKDHVFWTENEAEQNTMDTDVKVPPPVPFPFKPTPTPGTNVEFKIIHSYIYLRAEYDPSLPLTDPTPVIITLECQPFGAQRFLAIGIEIITGSEPSQAKVCELEEHDQKIPIEAETTDVHTNGVQFEGGSVSAAGVSVAIQGGASRVNTTTITEKGKRYAWVRPKPVVKIAPEGLIRWYLKAPMPVANPEGICGTESITCVFAKKPAQFKYACQVELIKNGVVKTVRRKSRH